MNILHGKIYTQKSKNKHRLLKAVIKVKDYWIFSLIASTEYIEPPVDGQIVLVTTRSLSRLKETDPKDYPLWVGSQYVSQELETLLKGASQ